MTVAIPDDNLHKPHSLTYGSRQKAKDQVAAGQPHTEIRRLQYDAANPSSAFHRDANHLLDKTHQQDLFNPAKDSAALKHQLDMNNADSRLNLIGAYRYAGNLNVKLNENYGAGRGYNPQDPGQTSRIHHTTLAGSKKGLVNDQHQLTYTPTTTPGRTQGQLISNSFRDRLINEGFAQDVPDIGGSAPKRPHED